MVLHKIPQISRWPRAVLDWLCAGQGGYWRHCERQRSPRYRAMRSVCKTVWIGAGVIILLNPMVEVASVLALFATFLSFALLDESDYMN